MDRPLPRVGVVGVGELGGGIARSLLRAGHAVRFHDPQPDAGAGLPALGARRAATVAELAAAVDVVALVVVDDAQVRQVVRALGEAARPGLALAIHSTVAPHTAQAAAEALAPRGVSVLDAPVSGGPEAAEAGTLTIMVGGSDEALRRCRPLLDAIGDEVVALGPVGAGSAAKLANQLMLCGSWLFAREALALAGACGVDEAAMLRVARSSTGSSWALQHWEALSGPHFRELIGKDLRLALETAEQVGARCAAAGRVSGHL